MQPNQSTIKTTPTLKRAHFDTTITRGLCHQRASGSQLAARGCSAALRIGTIRIAPMVVSCCVPLKRSVLEVSRRALGALLVTSLLLVGKVQAQTRIRVELPFPDLPGFVTLRCDFHLHTVFSDGNVWPTIRAEEAWRDGLDAIALTDHIEYAPHKNEIAVNHARPYEIGRAHGETLGVIVIRAGEITRGEPPGHLNALFLTNVAAVNEADPIAAVKVAFEQGGFLFWNHPGWKQPGRKSVWYAEQEQFFTNGWLRGIEIVNGTEYDAIAHQWCLDKKLTMLGNSDIHDPVGFHYGAKPGEWRPMTLVFAKARTPEAIREALFARRTAVFSRDRLIGEAQFLEPLFQNSIEIVTPEIRFRGKGRALVQIRNKSPMNFELRFDSKLPGLSVPGKVVLAAGKVSLVDVRAGAGRASGEQEVTLPCKVENALVTPDEVLSTALRLKVQFDTD